jgi:hypothetical protein
VETGDRLPSAMIVKFEGVTQQSAAEQPRPDDDAPIPEYYDDAARAVLQKLNASYREHRDKFQKKAWLTERLRSEPWWAALATGPSYDESTDQIVWKIRFPAGQDLTANEKEELKNVVEELLGNIGSLQETTYSRYLKSMLVVNLVKKNGGGRDEPVIQRCSEPAPNSRLCCRGSLCTVGRRGSRVCRRQLMWCSRPKPLRLCSRRR